MENQSERISRVCVANGWKNCRVDTTPPGSLRVNQKVGSHPFLFFLNDILYERRILVKTIAPKYLQWKFILSVSLYFLNQLWTLVKGINTFFIFLFTILYCYVQFINFILDVTNACPYWSPQINIWYWILSLCQIRYFFAPSIA